MNSHLDLATQAHSAHAASKVQVPDPSPPNCRMTKMKPSSMTNRARLIMRKHQSELELDETNRNQMIEHEFHRK